MCKVAGIANVNDSNRQDAWLFMMILGEYMSKWNEDGLGYAAFDKSGNLFGERWLINKTAFCDLNDIQNIPAPLIKSMYSSFGQVNKSEAQAIILHTRAATCERGIHNAHPFVNDIVNPTSAIIHNGMISNDHMFVKKYSTCDSEVIVHLYDQLKVSENLENVKQVMRELIGWFTVLALTKDPENRLVMDIFTDAPRLHSYHIKELDTRVYSTDWNHIELTAREFGMTCVEYMGFKANTAHRIDVLTGKMIQTMKTTGKFEYTGSGQVIYAEGNADDMDFNKQYSGGD